MGCLRLKRVRGVFVGGGTERLVSYTLRRLESSKDVWDRAVEAKKVWLLTDHL